MKWTREKPTQPGWYWWRAPRKRPRVLLVSAYAFTKTRYQDGLGGDVYLVENMVPGEWAGPIPEPEEVTS